MLTPYTFTATSTSRNSRKRRTFLGILALASSFPHTALPQETAKAPAFTAKAPMAQPDCAMAITAREASRCIGGLHPATLVPTLDGAHTYNLPELIDLAETASPEGRIAWAKAKHAMEEAGVERAQYLPLLTFAAQGSDLRAIVPFPMPIAPRGYVTVEEPTALAQLELQYSLLDFGRRPRLEESKALEVASTLQLGRMHQTIAFHTATEFYRAQLAAGQLDAANAILETARTLLANAQSQYDNGRATLPDVQNAQAGAAEAEYDLADAQGEAKKAKLALTEAIGVEPTIEIRVVPQDATPADAFDRPIEELLQSAWKTRPDLLAKVQDLHRAEEATRAAHAVYLPTVGLTGAAGRTSIWAGADFGQLGPASVSTWSAAIQLRWDVFNGARQHQVSSAAAEERAAAEEKRAAQDSVTRQVWESYVDYQTALEQERASQSFLTSSQTSYDSSLDAFRYGVRSLVDVVQAERQLAQARLAAVRARSYRLQSAFALGYAIGDPSRGPATSAGVNP